jgi:hypothetical protein
MGPGLDPEAGSPAFPGPNPEAEHAVDADHMRAVLAAGVSRDQIEDALAVGFCFNTIGRLADAFGFSMPGPAAFEAGAKHVLARGYR